MEKKLYRSKTDKIVFGVCGGVAEYFGIDSTLVRIITIALFMLHQSFAVFYIILGIIIPENPNKIKGKPAVKIKNNYWMGIGLVVIGGFLLLDSYNILDWSQFWPGLLIIGGLYLLWLEGKKK